MFTTLFQHFNEREYTKRMLRLPAPLVWLPLIVLSLVMAAIFATNLFQHL